MVLSYHLKITGLFFITGFITNFSNLAEKEWLRRYDIFDITLIEFYLQVAWNPPLQALMGLMIDRIRRCVHLGFQAAAFLVIPLVLWTIVTIDVLDEEGRIPTIPGNTKLIQLSDFSVLVMIAIAEVGPSLLRIILSAMLAVQFNQDGTNLSFLAELTYTLGVLIGNWSGGQYMHIVNSIGLTFIVHTVFHLFAYIIAISVGLEQRKQQQYNVIVDLEQKEDDDDEYTRAKREPINSIFLKEQEESHPPPVPKLSLWMKIKNFCTSCIPFLFGHDTNDSKSVRTFRNFIAIACMIPSAGDAFFYYCIGPLHFTMSDMGNFSAIASISEILGASFVMYLKNTHNKVLPLRTVAYLIAFAMTWTQFVHLVLVSQVWYHLISNYVWMVLLRMMTGMIRGIGMVTMTSIITETASVGNEGVITAWKSGMPKMLMYVQILADTALTKYYKVNHLQYNGLPLYLVCTSMFSLIFMWSVLFVSTDTQINENK